MLTIKERTFLVEWVFRSGNKYTDTVKQKFTKTFPYSVVPHRNTVRDLIKKFKSTGSVEDAERSGRPNVLSDEILLSVCDKLLANPSTSLRKLSRELEISLGSAHTAVKKITEQKQKALGDFENPQAIHQEQPQRDDDPIDASEKVGVYSDFEKAYTGTMSPDQNLLKITPKDIFLKYCQSICTPTN